MSVMKFGYARVSTDDQELARQIDALNNYGVDKIYKEKITGTKASRPELDKLKNAVREGDSVVIESLSRLGRSTKDLLALAVDYYNRQTMSVKEITAICGISQATLYRALNEAKTAKK